MVELKLEIITVIYLQSISAFYVQNSTYGLDVYLPVRLELEKQKYWYLKDIPLPVLINLFQELLYMSYLTIEGAILSHFQ